MVHRSSCVLVRRAGERSEPQRWTSTLALPCRVLRWRHVAQRRVRTTVIEVQPEVFDHDPCLRQAREQLEVEALISQLPIERFAEGVLPWRAGLDERRLR